MTFLTASVTDSTSGVTGSGPSGPFTIDIPSQSQSYNQIVIQGEVADGTALEVDDVLLDGGESILGGASIAVSGDATITAEVANTFTTTAETSTGDSTATAKTSGADWRLDSMSTSGVTAVEPVMP